MNDIFLDLIDIIDKEKDEYLTLLQLSKEKKEVLVSVNIKKLDDIIGQEQKILYNIAELENIKYKYIEIICKDKNLKKEDINISKITELSDNETKKRLKSLTDEFKKIIDEINFHNNLNTKLIESHLDYIDVSFSLLLNKDNNTSYNNDGMAKNDIQFNSQILDKKVWGI